jgi:hypothetical protein
MRSGVGSASGIGCAMKLTPEFFESEYARMKQIAPYCVEGAPEDYLGEALLQVARSLRNLHARDQQGSKYRLPSTFQLETEPIPEVDVLGKLWPNEKDPTRLWAEIWKLRNEALGPGDYQTWRDAALDERQKRLSAEADLAALKEKIKGLVE